MYPSTLLHLYPERRLYHHISALTLSFSFIHDTQNTDSQQTLPIPLVFIVFVSYITSHMTSRVNCIIYLWAIAQRISYSPNCVTIFGSMMSDFLRYLSCSLGMLLNQVIRPLSIVARYWHGSITLTLSRFPIQLQLILQISAHCPVRPQSFEYSGLRDRPV